MRAPPSPRTCSTGTACRASVSKRACRNCAAGSKMPTLRGRAFGLKLPGLELPPNIGPAHRQRCLTALALFDAEARTRMIRSHRRLLPRFTQQLIWVVAAWCWRSLPHAPDLRLWIVAAGADCAIARAARHRAASVAAAAEAAAHRDRAGSHARRARDVSHTQRTRSGHGLARDHGRDETARNAQPARSDRADLRGVLPVVRRHFSTTSRCCACRGCWSRRGCSRRR